MKVTFTLLLSIIYCFVNGQTIIDEYVTVDFPGMVDTSEVKIDFSTVKSFAYNTSEDSHVVLKISVNNNEISLPRSKAKLKQYYNKVTTKTISTLDRKGLKKDTASFIKLDNYLVYRVLFTSKSEQKENGELWCLFVDKKTYFFIYSKINSYSEETKYKFFESIEIKENLKQTKGILNWIGIIKSLLVIVLSSIILMFIKRNKTSS